MVDKPALNQIDRKSEPGSLNAYDALPKTYIYIMNIDISRAKTSYKQ